MKKKPEFDLNTSCTECGYSIPPREILRISFDLVRCPKCGRDFKPVQKGSGISTS